MGNVNVCGVRHKVDMDQLRASVAVLQQHDPALSIQSAYITAARDVLDNHTSDYHDLRQFAEAQYQLKVDKLRQIEKPDAASENSHGHQPFAKESPAAFPVNEQSAISTPERKVIDQSTPNQSMGGGYTKSGLIQALTQKMDSLYGKGWTGRLFKTGKFEVIGRDEAIKIGGDDAKNAQGFYDAKTSKSYLVNDNIPSNATAKELKGLMQHEIAVHTLQLGKNDPEFQAILKQVEKLRETSSKVKEAFEQVPEDTNPDNIVEETLAYLTQRYPGLPIVRKFLAWFRNAVRNIGKALPALERARFFQWANNLNESDLLYMADRALRSAPEVLADNKGNAADVKFSMDDPIYKKQYKAIEAQYFNEDGSKKAGALLAPNGKPSNLNKTQWIQVRTDAFKRWFGSWQEQSALDNLFNEFGASDRGEMFSSMGATISNSKILNSIISSIPVDVVNNLGGHKGATNMLLNNPSMFIDILSLPLRNPDVFSAFSSSSESVIALTRAKLSNTKPASSNAKIISTLYTLQNNLVATLQASNDKDTRISGVHTFSSARSTAKFLTLGTFDKFNITELANHNKFLIDEINNDYTIDQSALKEFNASKVVDENGEPLVVYHGTDTDIDKFSHYDVLRGISRDKDKAKAFFTDDSRLASIYARTRFSNNLKEKGKLKNLILNNGVDINLDYDTDDYLYRDDKYKDVSVYKDWKIYPPSVYSLYLNIKNPFILDLKNQNYDDVLVDNLPDIFKEYKDSRKGIPEYTLFSIANRASKRISLEELYDLAIDKGFDGVMARNVIDSGALEYNKVSNVFIASKQWQIKSATGNTGAFSAKNNDIRYAKKQYPTSVTELEEIIQGSTLTTTPTTWQNIKDKTVEYLTDSTRPFDVWTRALPDKIATARLIAAKDLAKGKKQAFEKEAMLRFGNAISKDIFELANHMQVDFDYAKEMAGQWLTMRYARVANNRLLNRYESLADEAAQALDDFENNPDPNLTPEEFETERNKLKAASIRADKQVVKFVEAMNNDAIVDPTENSHAIGLAGGYNNKTAIHLRQAIEARVKNLPALHKIADNVYQMNAWKLEQDIKNGKVTQEAADKFDDSGWYVPLTGDPRNDDSVDDIFSVGNVNQQKDHRLEGRTSSIAQNGIDASFEQLEKSARYHGWNDFKTQLNSIYQTLLDDKIADGASHSEASKAIDQDYGLRRQPLRPGIMPRETDIIYRKDGKTAIFTIHNQAATDALRGKNTEDVPLIARIAQPITAWNARFVTQFQPTFAAINATRDILERSEHIRTREIPGYEQVDMNAVGNRALTIAFNPKTFRDLLPLIGQDVTGLRNIQNGASELFNEFINAGGVATWSSYLSSNREEFSKNLEKQNSRLGKGLNYIGTYNNAFDIVPGFAIFKALREQGIDSNAAAATTLNLMNFHKQGKAMPLVRAAYMFAQPIAHGGHQLTITLSTQRGQMRFLAMMTAGILLYSVLRASDDDDELGVNKYDQISNYVMERNIPIKIPGSDNRYFKMPIGFGPHQIAWGIAANLVKRANGYQTAGDTLVDISKIWVKTFAPVSPSDIPIKEHFSTWAMQTFTPTVFKGLGNVAMDVNSFGNPLTTPFKNKGYAKALQGKRNTPNEYKLFAQELAKFGFDLYPEQIRELTRNYLPNFLYPVIQAGIENPALEARGKPTIEPYASRFILQTDQERTKEQIFYRHLDKLAKASSEASLGGALTDKQKAQVQLFNRVEKLQHKMNGNMAAATKAEKAHQTGKAKLYKSRSDQIYEKMLDVVMADFRGE